MTKAVPTLGIKTNLAQFSLLVIVNAFVGAMVGMERSILPAIAEQEFLLAAGISLITISGTFNGFASGAVLLGAGTAMVYPTLLATIGDVAHPG